MDAERWVLVEAWIANGLRISWSSHRAGDRINDGRGSWQGDQGAQYRYVGWGEWECPRPHTYMQRPLGEETAPQLSTSDLRHELAHWLTATEDQRSQPNFGIADSGHEADEAERQAVAAERVIASIARAASRVVNLSLGGKP